MAGQQSSPPLRFGVAVFPQFEVLDTFGPVEALNQMTRGGYEWAGKLSLAILAETLDPVSAMPSGSLIDQKILPTHTFAEPPEIDVLLIPGGPGTEIPEVAKPVTDFVQRVYPSLHSLITVCTGAGIAARAGVLNGHKATTNKNYWAGITQYGPHTYWIAHARWVQCGNIWTTSGVSAGTDGMLAWVESAFGTDVANAAAVQMEWIRAASADDDPFTGKDEDVLPIEP